MQLIRKQLAKFMTLTAGLCFSISILGTNLHSSNNSVAVEPATLTVGNFADYLKTCNAHYPLSDEFIERYQQTSGGYIDIAKDQGLLVDKYQHEPNQRWHFYDDWFCLSVEEGTLSRDDDAKKRIYTGLLCPELLLWIYEACEVNNVKVRNAMKVAEEGKVAGTNVSTIAKNMRAIVSYEDVRVAVDNFLAKPTIVGVMDNIDLAIGVSTQLNPKLNSGSGTFTYSIKDTNIASIDNNGVIKGLVNGETTLTITCNEKPELVKEAHIIVCNHGNSESPLSISDALSLANSICVNNGDHLSTPIYVKGVAKDNASNTGKFTLVNNDESINVFESSLDTGISEVAQNDNVLIKGLLKKDNGSLGFGIEDSNNPIILENIRGLSSISLGKHEHAKVLINDIEMTEAFSKTNGESVSFTVSVDEGYLVKKVTINGNMITDISGTYTFVVKGNSEISIEASNGQSGEKSLGKYDIKYDLGTRKTAKQLETTTELLNTFSVVGKEDVIKDVTAMNYMYGGGNGGKSETAWYVGDMLKFGTTSVNGDFTISLTEEINRVKITGYTYKTTGKIRIGDSNSADWDDEALEDDNKTVVYKLSDMNETSKEVVEGKQVVTVTIDIPSTKSLKIAVINKTPLFMTGLELLYYSE